MVIETESELRCGSVVIRKVQIENGIVLCDLQGSGSAKDMLEMIRFLKKVSCAQEFFITVDASNPKAEKLMKLYTKFGAIPETMVFRAGGK